MLKPGMSYLQLQDLEKTSAYPDNQEAVLPDFSEEAQNRVNSIRQKLMDTRAKTKGKTMKKSCVCKNEEKCKKCMAKTEEAPTPKEENDKKISESKTPDMKKGMSFHQLREQESLHKSESLIKSKMDALLATGNKDLIAKTLEKIKGIK